MPAIVFTCNAATDTLTATAHGLATGDVFRAVAAGGTLPTASGGDIAEATDYFAIRTDADHLKVARSQALAMAGTSVDLTGAGSGQQYLLVGLPFTRARTYAAGAQVRSVDLNALQDHGINAKANVVRRNVPLLLAFTDPANTWAPDGSRGGVRSTAITSPSVHGSWIDCPYDVGDVMLGIEIWRRSDGTASSKTALLTLAVNNALIIADAGAGDTVATGATTPAKFIVPSSTDTGHVMASGDQLRLVIAALGSTGYVITQATLLLMRP